MNLFKVIYGMVKRHLYNYKIYDPRINTPKEIFTNNTKYDKYRIVSKIIYINTVSLFLLYFLKSNLLFPLLIILIGSIALTICDNIHKLIIKEKSRIKTSLSNTVFRLVVENIFFTSVLLTFFACNTAFQYLVYTNLIMVYFQYCLGLYILDQLFDVLRQMLLFYERLFLGETDVII